MSGPEREKEGRGPAVQPEPVTRDAKLPMPAPAPRLIDVSRPLAATTPVWPGDAPTRPAWTARIADGASVNVGQLASSLHAATHADAPLHFAAQGAAIDAVGLAAYYGEACILERIGPGPILPDEIKRAVGAMTLPAPRVLFRTWPGAPPAHWVDDFAYFHPDTIHALADLGAVLVGIDTPSFDAADSTELPSHHALHVRGVLNLENLDLSSVQAGERYVLSAFPLRIAGMDASPVRAVLIA